MGMSGRWNTSDMIFEAEESIELKSHLEDVEISKNVGMNGSKSEA
jgi:hypothetical protein